MGVSDIPMKDLLRDNIVRRSISIIVQRGIRFTRDFETGMVPIHTKM